MAKNRWIPLAWAATVLVLALCLAPRRWVPTGERTTHRLPHQDKAVHLIMFAAFGFCWARAVKKGRLSPAGATTVLAAAAVFAVGTELAQGHPAIDRDPDALDALADLAGAAVGVGLAALGRRG